MHDQALIWNTDSKLQVTSLTARLRDLAGIGCTESPTLVSDLWGTDEPFGIAVISHHWALDGESLAFEATFKDVAYHFELEPLRQLDGEIAGVTGRAIEAGRAGSQLAPEVLIQAERSAGIGTWHEDLRTGHVTISGGLAALLGIERRAGAFSLRAFDHPAERYDTAQAIHAALTHEGAYSHDHRILCDDSRLRWVRERVRTLCDERGLAYARVGTLIDVSDFAAREAELAELAHYDALTHLPNRALLDERLASSVARCERHELQCAVLFLDLDGFKEVNDSFGHLIGDRLLVRVGERLSRHIRASDTVARLGGDEFVILIEDLMSVEAAVDAAHKILRSFDEPFEVERHAITAHASIGIATYPLGGCAPSELIERADAEMYAVKRNGGRGVKLALPEKESARISDEKAMCQTHSSRDRDRYATRVSA